MTQLVGSSILVNVFACNLTTMSFVAVPVAFTGEMFILIQWVQFMLDPAECRSLSGH